MSNITKGAAGTLPNGQAYGNQLANANGNNEIILGGGSVYIMPVAGLTSLPSDEEIEGVNGDSQYNVGWCESGFKINYKPKTTEVYNQFEQLVKTFITREELTVKTGILTWNLKNISLLSNATMIPATASNMENRVVFTGSGELNTVLLRFVYTKANGKKIRFTMIGQGGTGFGMDFGDKATSVNAEIKGIQYFNNFLAEFREELSSEEFDALYPSQPTTPATGSNTPS